MHIVVPVGLIPDDETVTKVTGHARFIVKRTIKIYVKPEHGKHQQITPADNTVFLVDTDGTINQVSEKTEIAYHANSLDELRELLADLVEHAHTNDINDDLDEEGHDNGNEE